MNIKTVLKYIPIAVCIIMTTIMVFAIYRVKSLKKENDRLLHNQEVLLTQNETIIAESQMYKVSDSLNAAKVSELQFTLKEYKRYRAKDLQIIERLKTKKSDLQKVINSQTQTINNLRAQLSDSIVIDTIANIADTLKCFNYKSKWTDVSGCINNNDSIDIQIKNRESIKIVETVKYKRFLGFLWKTNKVKDRRIDVVSENPNTSITNIDYVNIKQ